MIQAAAGLGVVDLESQTLRAQKVAARTEDSGLAQDGISPSGGWYEGYAEGLRDQRRGTESPRGCQDLADALDGQLEFVHQLLDRGLTPDEPGHLDFALESRTDFLELGRVSRAGALANYAARHWNLDVAEADIENVYLEFGYAVPESPGIKPRRRRLGSAGQVFVHGEGARAWRGPGFRPTASRKLLRRIRRTPRYSSTSTVECAVGSSCSAERSGQCGAPCVPDELSLRTLGVRCLLLENGMEEQGGRAELYSFRTEMGLC